jgi:hypothetical protein
MGSSLQLHRQCIFNAMQGAAELTLSKEAYMADHLYSSHFQEMYVFIYPQSVIKIKSLIYCNFSRSTVSVILLFKKSHIVFVCTFIYIFLNKLLGKL